MRQQEARQRRLFEDNNVHVPPLRKEVAQQAAHELMQWIIALANAMGAGVGDEQNKR